VKTLSKKTTTQELQADIERFVHDLADQTEKSRTSDTFRRYLDTMSRFWEYSFGNQILIHMQCPNASRVAGFQTWIRLGRHVKKGEHGIRILAPRIKRGLRLDEATGEEVEKNVRYFQSVCVFDVSQTEGDPLPSSDILLHGDDFSWLRDKLLSACARRGIEVSYKNLGINGALGYASKKGIVLGEDQNGNTEFNTLVHELAHMMLHVGVEANRESKAIREIEAEGTAYVVMRHYGLKSKSFNYLAMYTADPKQILSRMKWVSGTSREIIGMINEKCDA
jgi:hypothetical protein